MFKFQKKGLGGVESEQLSSVGEVFMCKKNY